MLTPFFGIDKGRRFFSGIQIPFLIPGQDHPGQRLQAALFCHSGSGAPLGSEGKVNVLQLGKSLCRQQPFLQIWREQVALGKGLNYSLASLIELSAALTRRSRIFAIATSSRFPVASFRYLAMKGRVAPESSSSITASTWASLKDSS